MNTLSTSGIFLKATQSSTPPGPLHQMIIWPPPRATIGLRIRNGHITIDSSSKKLDFNITMYRILIFCKSHRFLLGAIFKVAFLGLSLKGLLTADGKNSENLRANPTSSYTIFSLKPTKKSHRYFVSKVICYYAADRCIAM